MLKQAFYKWVVIAFLGPYIIMSHSVQSALSTALTEREQAKRLAVIINDVLSSYIEVHNDVFKESARRLIPIPGYFEAINFKQHVENLKKLYGTLGQIDQEITRWLGSDLRDPKVRTFIVALQSYSRALSETIEQFDNISQHLYRQTRDPSNYDWESYSRDLDTYEKAIEGYHRLGTNLNELYRLIQR